MTKFVTLVLEPRFEDEYGEYANLPVFNAHGDIVGYTGGEVPEVGNPCEFNVMNEEGFPVCYSVAEVAKLRKYAHVLELENIRLDSENCDLRGEMDPAITQNRELRKLAVDLYRDASALCKHCDCCYCNLNVLNPLDDGYKMCLLVGREQDRMEKLGLETL